MFSKATSFDSQIPKAKRPQEVPAVLPSRGERAETPGAIGAVAGLRGAAGGGQRGHDHSTAGPGECHGSAMAVRKKHVKNRKGEKK